MITLLEFHQAVEKIAKGRYTSVSVDYSNHMGMIYKAYVDELSWVTGNNVDEVINELTKRDSYGIKPDKIGILAPTKTQKPEDDMSEDVLF